MFSSYRELDAIVDAGHGYGCCPPMLASKVSGMLFWHSTLGEDLA